MSAEPDFDSIARPYKYLEYLTLGSSLQRCRTQYLDQLLQQRSALILGDGDGRFLAQLLAANPDLCAEAVDTSRAMLDLLEANCRAATLTAAARLRTHHAAAQTFVRTLPPGRCYDLIVTHFFLDCLTQPEVETLIHALKPHLAAGALWVISDFHIPSKGTLRPIARAVVRSLYIAFRLLTGLRTTHLPDYFTPLSLAGLARIAHRDDSLGGLLAAELWQRSAPPNHSLSAT